MMTRQRGAAVAAALVVACWRTDLETSAAPTFDFQAAANYATRGNGHAILVVLDGQVLFERYDNGFTADRPEHLHSGTKSFWGSAVAPRKQTPLDYLKQRIFDPIGLRVADWVHDRAGNPHMPNGASLTAREWVKFGRFLLDRGRFQDRQIVRAELLHVEGSQVNPGYGFSVWRNEPGGYSSEGRGATSDSGGKGGWIHPAGLPDLYMAAGSGGNRLYVVPSQRLLIVRLGDSARFADARFPGLLFRNGSERVY